MCAHFDVDFYFYWDGLTRSLIKKTMAHSAGGPGRDGFNWSVFPQQYGGLPLHTEMKRLSERFHDLGNLNWCRFPDGARLSCN